MPTTNNQGDHYDNGTLPDGWERYPDDPPVLGPCGCDDPTPTSDDAGAPYCSACGEDMAKAGAQ